MASARSTLSPRKAPRQDRSRAMVELILEATARVLVERGYAGTSTNAVAARAGISVGSLYQYFPNKDALVAALHERHAQRVDEVVLRVLQRHAGATLAEALAAVIEAAIAAHAEEAELHQVLELQLAGLDRYRGPQADGHLAEHVAALLAAHRDEIAVPDPRLATFVLVNAVHALIHAAVLERPSGVSLRAATREILRMAFGYLTTPAVASTSPASTR
jgi:AcrR family transcriptional regulator